MNIDYIFILGFYMILIVTPQNMHQSSVDHLFFPIYTWMECCRSLQICVHILPKCSLKGTKELRNMVSLFEMMLLGIKKVHPYLFKEHVLFFLSSNGIFTRHKNVHLSEPINYYKMIVMPLPSVGKTSTKSMETIS
jgi:hypothetical protein